MTTFENILINSCKADMITYLATHPEDFDQAIQLAISNNQPYSWRAAWLLWSCMKINDPRIQKYLNNIIKTLPTKNSDHQRELIKILLLMKLKEKQEGYLFDFCASVWERIEHKPSIRFNAFKMIVKITQKHPDLKNEIGFLTQNKYMDSLSSAARKSIYKMISD